MSEEKNGWDFAASKELSSVISVLTLGKHNVREVKGPFQQKGKDSSNGACISHTGVHIRSTGVGAEAEGTSLTPFSFSIYTHPAAKAMENCCEFVYRAQNTNNTQSSISFLVIQNCAHTHRNNEKERTVPAFRTCNMWLPRWSPAYIHRVTCSDTTCRW